MPQLGLVAFGLGCANAPLNLLLICSALFRLPCGLGLWLTASILQMVVIGMPIFVYTFTFLLCTFFLYSCVYTRVGMYCTQSQQILALSTSTYVMHSRNLETVEPSKLFFCCEPYMAMCLLRDCTLSDWINECISWNLHAKVWIRFTLLEPYIPCVAITCFCEIAPCAKNWSSMTIKYKTEMNSPEYFVALLFAEIQCILRNETWSYRVMKQCKGGKPSSFFEAHNSRPNCGSLPVCGAS